MIISSTVWSSVARIIRLLLQQEGEKEGLSFSSSLLLLSSSKIGLVLAIWPKMIWRVRDKSSTGEGCFRRGCREELVLLVVVAEEGTRYERFCS